MTETPIKAVSAGVRVPSFAGLPQGGSRWTLFGFSYLVEAVAVVVLAHTAISWVAPIIKPPDTKENVHLVAPELHSPASPPPVMAKLKEIPRPQPVLTPKITPPPVRETPPPKVELPKQNVEIAKLPQPRIPAPLVKTDTFKSPELAPGPKVAKSVVSTNFGGSSAPVTLNKPAPQVQTGGFGDPNGVPVNNNSTGKGPTIAKLGSFDLPEGPGTGNGTGGAKGLRGTVASAGFGNGIAVQGEGGAGGKSGQGTVRTTSFGAVQPSTTDSAPKRQVASGPSKDTPVALLTKPTPTYTLEARQRKIEGDVELDVEFTAAGRVHVLRVVQGLGYGLDEAAVRAAEQIHFSPARRDGQPVDSQGRLRIVFRLS